MKTHAARVAVAAAALLVTSNAHAIVGGTADTTRPDVLLLQDDTLAGFRCTATLVAPNLVITARHCVGKRSAGTTLCKGGATDDGASALPNYQGDVEASPMYVSAGPGAPLLARGKTIFDDGSTTTCAHDLALIELDRPIAGITPSAMRRTPVAVGEPLLVMGFGWTDRNATVNATERMKGSTSVLALGPTVFSFKPFGDTSMSSQPVAVASGEIAVNGLTMTGDSGGPAFDGAGRVAALVSRGYSDAYYGPATFTTLAAHLPVIDAALAATGNAVSAPDAGADAGADARAAPAPSTPDGGAGTPDPGGAGSDAGNGAADEASSNEGGCTMSPASRKSSGPSALLLGLAFGIALAARARRRRASASC